MFDMTKEEQAAFDDEQADRAMAIVLPVIVENHLTSALKLSMKPDEKVANELFQPSGPIGNFGTKIRLAYMWGLIGTEIYRDLLIINRIRNEFAHKIETKFDDKPIKQWIEKMHVYSILVAIRDEKWNDKNPVIQNDKTFKAALRSTLRWQLQTPRGAFREALRMYIGKLIQIEQWVHERSKDPSKKPGFPPNRPPLYSLLMPRTWHRKFGARLRRVSQTLGRKRKEQAPQRPPSLA